MQVERRQVTVVRPQLGHANPCSEDNTQCAQALQMNNCNLVTWHGLTLARVAAERPKKPRKKLCSVQCQATCTYTMRWAHPTTLSWDVLGMKKIEDIL